MTGRWWKPACLATFPERIDFAGVRSQRTVKRFEVRRIVGKGDLWITEFVLAYDGRPSYSVSVMEFVDGKVARETQYFGEQFEPGPSRAHLVERMG